MSTPDFSLINVMYAFIVVSMAFAFLRLVLGPYMPDRLVALEVIAMLSIGLAAILAIETDQQLFLDVGIVIALIAFLGTVAFATYLERTGTR
jgi:multicomponent Na+:H+ antiporter subunit F